jgi:uncharacterized protein
MSSHFTSTDRTRLRRRPQRGSSDRALGYAILDEALFCSVGFAIRDQPFVIPMVFARWDDRIVLHGAPASRLLELAETGARVCVTATLIDGLVLARSAMHHSMNYRSIVVLGTLSELSSPVEKREALSRVIEHALPGRTAHARPPSDKELAATKVLALSIEEASIKVRSGGPVDDDADLDSECWAGVLPLALTAQPPVADEAHPPTARTPPELFRYQRRVRSVEG